MASECSGKTVQQSCLRTWLNGNNKISLYRTERGDEFEFRIINPDSTEIKRDIVKVASQAIQSLLDRWDPILNSNGLIDYEHLETHFYDGWDETVFSESNDETIQLGSKEYADKELLIWRLSNKKTNTASWICASEGCGRTVINIETASVSVSPETFKQINKHVLENFSSEEKREALSNEFLRKFKEEYPDEKIVEIYRKATKYEVVRSSGTLVSVGLKFPSKYNSEKFIDTKRWAVTLLSTGSSSGHWLQRFGGHAMILYEGVDQTTGLPFRKYAHLYRSTSKNTKKATPKVRIRDVHYVVKTEESKEKKKKEFYLPIPIFIYESADQKKDEVLERTRSKTFFLSSEQVERMISKIKQDIEKSPEHSSSLSFSPFGPIMNATKSISEYTLQRFKGTLEENCLSYAVEALRVAGIYLPEPKGVCTEPDNYIKHLESEYTIEETNGHFIAYESSGKSSETDVDELTRAAMKLLMSGEDFKTQK